MIYAPDERAALTAAADALWEANEATREEMSEAAVMACYYLNGDHLEEAHQSAQEYFDGLAVWTARAVERESIAEQLRRS